MNKELTDEQTIEKAFEIVRALCLPRNHPDSREWSMSIPVRADYDPDLIIAKGLLAGRQAIKERDELKAENDRLREALRTICYEHPSRDTISEICEKALEGVCQSCGVGSPEHGLVAGCVLAQLDEQETKGAKRPADLIDEAKSFYQDNAELLGEKCGIAVLMASFAQWQVDKTIDDFVERDNESGSA